MRTLAEAVAIVKAEASAMGLKVGELQAEKVALWALDLSNAYRELAVSKADWWLQQFIWSDGIRLDMRCIFGSAHLVAFFERVSTFILTVIQRRVRAHDRQHPLSPAREQLRRHRGRRLFC